MVRSLFISPVTAVWDRVRLLRGVSAITARFAGVACYSVLYLLGIVSEETFLRRLCAVTEAALFYVGDVASERKPPRTYSMSQQETTDTQVA